MTQKYKVIIVGAGPAGISCAIQLKRFGIDVCVFEKNEIGGLVSNAYLIENICGFPNGVKGSKYAELIKKQYKNFKIKTIIEEIKKIKRIKNLFSVETNKSKYICENLVVATGSEPIRIPFKSKKIFYELTQVLKYRNKKFVIIGSGDLAFDYALSLSTNNHVSLVIRNENIKCIESLKERVFKRKKINIENNLELTEVKEIDNRVSLQFIHKKESSIKKFKADALIVAVGRTANNNIISNLMGKKYNNLFLIGDVSHPEFRQTSIACGDGIKTAMIIYNKYKNA